MSTPPSTPFVLDGRRAARFPKKEQQHQPPQQQQQQATSDAITFRTSNNYPPVTSSKWDHIAEPYRSTTFTASSTVGDPDTDVFQWSFEDGTVLEGRY